MFLAGAGRAQTAATALPLAARLGFNGQNGFEARGTAQLVAGTSRIAASFDLLAWGAHHRLLVIQIPGMGTCREVVNGTAAQVWKPVGFPSPPAPGGPGAFSLLLPQASLLSDLAAGQASAQDAGATTVAGAAAEAVRLAPQSGSTNPRATMEVDLDAASGLPVRGVRTDQKGRQVSVAWSRYRQAAAGFAYPAHIEESVGGQLRLVLDVTHIEARTDLGKNNFAIPAEGSR